MNARIAGWPVCVLFGLAASSATAQQPLTRMGGLVLSAYSGGAAHTDLQRSTARVNFSLAGLSTERSYTRRLSPSTSPTFGVAVGYWPTRRWGFRAQAGFTPSRFEVTVSDREKAGLPADSAVLGTARYAGLRIWSYDVNLLFRAPFTPRGRVAPYGIVGAGLVRYQPGRDETIPPDALETFGDGRQPTRIAALIGAGALVPLQRSNLALAFELTDHIVRTPVAAGAGSQLFDSGVRLTLDPPRESPAAGRVLMTNHLRLLVGGSWLAR